LNDDSYVYGGSHFGDNISSFTQTYNPSTGVLSTSLITDKNFFSTSSVIAGGSGGEIISSLSYDVSSHILELTTNLSSYDTSIITGDTIENLVYDSSTSILTLQTLNGDFTTYIQSGSSATANIFNTDGNLSVSQFPSGTQINLVSNSPFFVTLDERISENHFDIENLNTKSVSDGMNLHDTSSTLATTDFVISSISSVVPSYNFDFEQGKSFRLDNSAASSPFFTIKIPELSNQPSNSALMFTMSIYREGTGATLFGQ